MREKDYSIDDVQDILDNLKKEFKNRVVQAGSHESLAREKALLSCKENSIVSLLEKKADVDEKNKGEVPSGIYEHIISLVNEAIEITLTSKHEIEIRRVNRILHGKCKLLDYKIGEYFEKEYVEKIMKASTPGEVDRIGSLYQRKDRAINQLNEILGTDYSKDYFKKTYEEIRTAYEGAIKRATTTSGISRIVVLIKSKIDAIKKLSAEYARIKNNNKGKIPSGHPEITVIEQAERAIKRATSPNETSAITSITMEKLKFLRE